VDNSNVNIGVSFWDIFIMEAFRSIFIAIALAISMLSGCSNKLVSPHVQGNGEVTDSLVFPALITHWKLDGNCNDAVGNNHGINNGVTYVQGVDGRKKGAAFFDGKESFVEVADSCSLDFGYNEFSVSLWVKVTESAGIFGDIISKYDPVNRKGLNLYIAGSSPGYDSISDMRNVHFGIDNGIVSSWVDCGKPSVSAPLVTCLVTYKGDLYAGVATAENPNDACRVFRYAGGEKWIDCGRLGNDPLTPSVQSMVVHKGHLYAGTGTWDWHKGSIGGVYGATHVYRYEGGTKWVDCGQVGEGSRLFSMASFDGDLYTSDDMKKVYRYMGDNSWVCCGVLENERQVNAMSIYKENLYGATHGSVYRYDDKAIWTCVGKKPFGVTQIHKLQVYEGKLYAGTWPKGQILRYESDNVWSDCGSIGIGEKYGTDEVMELTVYNGKLYGGVIPEAEVHRYEGGNNWTFIKRLVTRPDWSRENWSEKPHTRSRVPCMTIFQGKLYAGTGNCYGRCESDLPYELGRIFCMEAGKNISLDDDLGFDWKHLVFVREKESLKLYVDGKLRKSSDKFNGQSRYDISNDHSLLIGFGSLNYFKGALDNIQIYNGALQLREIRGLYNRRKLR
jgi:hypothetical protein